MINEKNDWLTQVYEAEGNRELGTVYDEWADRYDENLSQYGYRLPTVVIGLTGRYVRNRESGILDAGAGTGLLGEVLSVMGYDNLTGLDLSAGMLEVARTKEAYRELRQMVLGEHLDFADNTFDAVISAGTFTVGHAPPKSFEELIRITKSGGSIIFSIRCDGDNGTGFLSIQELLEKQGKWRLVDMTALFHSLPLKEPQVENRVFVYRVV